MLASEIIDGHISIHEMITQHGLTHPGKVWKHLQQHHHLQLPPFTLKQFTMRDGRKGRLTPALLLEHKFSFEELLRQVFPQHAGLSLQEKAFLTLLEEIFPDLQPQRGVELKGTRVHLYFHKPRVAVQLQGRIMHSTDPLQDAEGVQVLLFDPNQGDFSAGQAIFRFRQLLEQPPLSSNP